MGLTQDNIILFPKWREMLEEESLQALKEKRYGTALKKLNKLIEHKVEDVEIFTGKLICLMELGRLPEAQSLCEELLALKNENYLHYIHIYLTILLQTNQYELLMEEVQSLLEMEHLTPPEREQFLQLFSMSKKMKEESEEEEVNELLAKFNRAVGEGNIPLQWHYIDRLNKLGAEPENAVIEHLAAETIHPVIKTAIFQWLQAQQVTEPVRIHKFDKCKDFIPIKIERLDNNQDYKLIVKQFAHVEENNPTLFQVMKKLLYHFLYVLYPYSPSRENYSDIALALTSLGKKLLGIDTYHHGDQSATVSYYEDLIQYAETLYSSVIEE